MNFYWDGWVYWNDWGFVCYRSLNEWFLNLGPLSIHSHNS